jgi:hypothetical protein
MTNLPDDLLIAYQNFTLLATKLGFSYAGMMVCPDPPTLLAVGNVTQQGHDFAKLLREYADIIEQKTNDGMLVRPMFRKPN